MFQRIACSADLEVAQSAISPNRLEGYPEFAEFVARDRDAAIYRKFERLSARNLLYQQSELHDLEKQLENLDREDAKDLEDEAAQKAAVYWQHFVNDTSEQAQRRRSLQATIKLKLKEYHEALLLESQVLSLSQPASSTLRDFRRWFDPRSTGVNDSKKQPVLWGHDEKLFSDEHDLVALAPVDNDRLNIFLKAYFGYFFKEKRDELSPQREGLYYYPERRIQYVGLVVSTLLSAVLLIGAIVVLLLISDRSISLRVGMIVLFTCLFAVVVGLLTNASRADIFGSTAAYAAVLVVFISNFSST